MRRPSFFLPLLICLVTLPEARAAELLRYPEGEHGKGELKHINGLPVLIVEGTPEEMGEQIGSLAAEPARPMLDYPGDLLRHFRMGFTWPLFVNIGKQLLEQFPTDARQELEALVKSSGFERDKLIVANTMFDVKKVIACSALLVETERSATSGPLLGRNLDYPSLGYAQKYSLVTIYRPKGKHAFVSIGFPGLVGCLSGMNDAGLAVAVLEVLDVKDSSEKFNARGLPYALCYRQILEECTTVEEAAELLRSLPRITTTNLAVCDRNGGAIFEVTPKRVLIRRPVEGALACTNHFCTPELRPESLANSYNTLGRYRRLEADAEQPRIGIADLRRSLHAVSQREHTLQTMVFEPATLRLHLSIGSSPASAHELKLLELAPLFQPKP